MDVMLVQGFEQFISERLDIMNSSQRNVVDLFEMEVEAMNLENEAKQDKQQHKRKQILVEMSKKFCINIGRVL